MMHPDHAEIGSAVLRRALADAIEDLIALLDELDGDSDLEPSIGWNAAEASAGCYSGSDDREEDHEREHDEAERGIADRDGLTEQWLRNGVAA